MKQQAAQDWENVMKTFYGQFAETAPDWSCTPLMALLQNPTEPDPHGLREGS